MCKRVLLLTTCLALLAATSGTRTSGADDSQPNPRRLFPFCEDGKSGYMDRRGNTVIEPRFDRAGDFAEGLAVVALEKRRTYIDRRGVVQVTVPRQWRHVRPFSEGLAACRIDGKYGFFDRQGKLVIPPRYDEASDFREGLAAVGVDTGSRPYPKADHTSKVYGFIDKNGREVVQPTFRWASDFHEGLSYVCFEGGVGYIDERGTVVIRLEHEVNACPKRCRVYAGYDFSEGLALIEIVTSGGGEYRYINKAGVFLPRERFPTPAGDFCEGLAQFAQGDKSGYVDRRGHIVCKPMFDNAGCFSEGFAALQVGDYFGYVDRQMRFIIRPGESCSSGTGPLNDGEPFSGGLARVHIGGFFDDEDRFGGNWFFGTWFYMNENGDLIRRIRHDNESGPGYGMEYRPYGTAPEVSEEMKRNWEALRSSR